MTIPNRRRRFVIDRLQYHLLAINLFYSCVVALVFTVLLFGPLIQQLLLPELGAVERNQASDAFLTLHQRVWPPLIIALVCLTIHSLVVSHRIAGPLYRFRALFARLKEGDLTARAQLRQRDYLTTEAKIINEMSASLERKLLEMQRSGLDLCAALGSLKRELLDDETRPTTDVLNLIEILDTRADEFRRSIVGFKTTPGTDELGVETAAPVQLAPDASAARETAAAEV